MKSSGPAIRVPGFLPAILAVLLMAMTAGTAFADPEPSPTDASAQPPLATVKLTAATASSSVAAGGLVIIEGTLTDQGGAPVSGVRIRVMLDDNESSDSLVLTDESGAFQTFAEVPSERPAGEASLVVAFAGNDDYEATQQEIGLIVEDIPVADRTTPEASATPTDVADASASVDPSMGAAGDVDAAEDMEDGERNPLSWFYVTLVVVGGAALLITAGLVIRGIYGRSHEPVSRRAGSLDMLLEQASEDGEELDGQQSVTPDEGLSEHMDANPDSGEDAQPRRGTEK